MSVCSCNTTLNNTGTPSCQPIQKVLKRLILVNTYKTDGTKNYVDPDDTLDAAYITAKLNNSDGSQRWYPSPELKNIVNTRGDATYETFNDNSKIFVQQGVKSFEGLIVKASTAYLSQLDGFRCTDISAWGVDKDGSLIGTLGTDGFIYPIQIDAQSWLPTYVEPTDTESAKIALRFDWDVEEEDENLRMISASAFGTNLLSINGLLDVTGVVSSITSTTFAVKLKTDFGSVNDPILAKGWVLADFALYNVTDASSITITSVTENPLALGNYAFVIPAQTAGDQLRLTDAKNGYELAAVTFTAV